MKPKYLSFIPFIFLCLSASQVLAGIRPSFNLETCSWNATAIVIATEGERIDGVFRVLESLKGYLSPGDTIRVPALASFKTQSSRVVSDPSYPNDKRDPHLFVTGGRMILFLKRDSQESEPDRADNGPQPTASINWRPANFDDEINVSVIWIERGQAFGFVQLKNPGPSLLIRLGMSEDELRSRAREVIDTQQSFDQSAALNDCEKRVEALAPFAHHSFYPARFATFEELAKCGNVALPVLRRMLADDSLIGSHPILIIALAEAGKSQTGPDFTSLIQRDLEFWKDTGPVLKRGWWNGEGFASLQEVEPLRDRYGRDYNAIEKLRFMPYRGSETVVTEFRDFWGSLPQLSDVDSHQMGAACDEALRAIARLKSEVAIRFQGLQALDEFEMLKVLREKRVMPRAGREITPDLIEEAQTAIKEALVSHGYVHATVRGEFDVASRALTFAIDEGKRAGIADIRFEGNRIFSSERLGVELKQCLTDYTGNDGYNSQALDVCLHRLENFVRSKGYLQARFHDPETKETTDGLVFTIQAEEGILYRLGKFTIEGSKFLSSEQVRATIDLQEGDIANGEKISKALFEDLKKQYGSDGFIQYTAEIIPTFKDNPRNANEGIVDFEVTIEEGKQFRLHSIKFVGSDLPRKQLLGLLLIREGEIFSQELYYESIEKLNETGLFDPIDKDRDADFKTDEDQGLVSIVVKVNGGPRAIEPEQRTLKLRQPEPPQ